MVTGIAIYYFGIILMAGWNRRFGYNGIVYLVSCNLESAAFALITIVLSDYFGFRGRVSRFLGEISYDIYLLHGLVIELFVEPKCIITQDWYILAVIGTTIIISSFIHKINLFVMKLSMK